ncbi:hypothetical protein QCA50_003976 [Cerrena zonata]|uniref:Uncharacterized protein n=1 Tax=Cerrena zonata TaxID=2478898 RepID=A0AAW0GHW2_9APHY
MAIELAGTSDYFPSLLSKIHDTHPDVPIDSVILQAILLCIVAGKSDSSTVSGGTHASGMPNGSKYLLLRTREDDVNMVVNIVVTILTTVFGFPTHKSRIKSPATTTTTYGHGHHPSSGMGSISGSSFRRRTVEAPETVHPDQFLRSLFFKPQRHSKVDSILTGERDRKNSSSRRSGRFAVRRATTYPLEHDEANAINAPATGGGLGVSLAPPPPSSVISHSKDMSDDGFYEAASMASSRRPLLPTGGTPASTIRSTSTRPISPRVQTDPTPLLSIFQPPSLNHPPPPSLGHASHVSYASHASTITAGPVLLPKALVLSGLENTEVSAQRTLMQVLTDRRLVLDNDEMGDMGEVWNLPEDFFCVYVCSLDPSDRPPVLLGLVSPFSLFSLLPERKYLIFINPKLDKFAMSIDINIPPAVRQVYTSYRAANAPPSIYSPSPRSPTSPLKPLTPSSEHTASAVPSRMNSNIVRPGSAGPPVNKSPIVTSVDIAKLRSFTNSPPFISQETTDLWNQIDSSKRDKEMAYTAIHPSLNMYLADLFSATRHHPEFDSALLTLRAHKDAEDLVRAFRVINGDTLGTELISSVSANVFAAHHNGNGHLMASGTEDETGSSRALSKMDDESLGWGKMEDGDDVLMNLHGRKDSREHDHGGSLGIRVQAPDGSSQEGVPFIIDDLGLHLDGPEMNFPDPPPQIWDVSEVDIARIFPRVVSHRLKVREGPDDEILGSLMFPAVDRGVVQNRGVVRSRRSVKEILVEVLADV